MYRTKKKKEEAEENGIVSRVYVLSIRISKTSKIFWDMMLTTLDHSIIYCGRRMKKAIYFQEECASS